MRKFSLKILSGSLAGLSQSFGVSSAMTLWEQCLPFPGLAHAKSIENSRFTQKISVLNVCIVFFSENKVNKTK